jgi:putative transposase
MKPRKGPVIQMDQRIGELSAELETAELAGQAPCVFPAVGRLRLMPSRALPTKAGLASGRPTREADSMMLESTSYPRHRFPAEIIDHSIWLCHVFCLSLRDVELILAERGVLVTHESIRHWSLKFGADFARRLRRRRPQPGDTCISTKCSSASAGHCIICGAL